MKKGFTLAEVLITMGVIGVVAALTIPSLSTQYQKRVLTTQLQKAYAELSQAGAMVIANEMTSYFHQSRAVRNRNFIGPYVKTGGSGSFASNYALLSDKNTQYNFLGDISNRRDCGSMLSGAVVCVDDNGKGILDVNGAKGPNLIGRDAFTIWFDRGGKVTSDYSPSLKYIMSEDWDLDAAL